MEIYFFRIDFSSIDYSCYLCRFFLKISMAAHTASSTKRIFCTDFLDPVYTKLKEFLQPAIQTVSRNNNKFSSKFFEHTKKYRVLVSLHYTNGCKLYLHLEIKSLLCSMTLHLMIFWERVYFPQFFLDLLL